MFDNRVMGESLERRERRVSAQHWEHPWQELTNALAIPPRGRQHDCGVAVQAYLVWAEDGPQTVETIAYAWSLGPRRVLVQINDRRCQIGGAWLGPWDVWPRGVVGGPWRTAWGSLLDEPPWAG